MKDKLEALKEKVKNDINSSLNEQDLLKLKSTYLGKDSEVMQIMKGMKDLSIEKKKEIGKLANETKAYIENRIKERLNELVLKKENKRTFDNTLPVDKNIGSLSPITIVANEVADCGRVSVNGKIVKPSYDVKVGDIIEIQFGDKASKFEIVNIPKVQGKKLEETIKLL